MRRRRERLTPTLAESNKTWWHDFWSKGYVRLHSDDGVADSVEQNYTYYLYVMASSSRGKFPAKFNGMIWTTGGDKRSWGGHYWGANQKCMYNALLPTNRMELLDPMFKMYCGMYNSCSWRPGSNGAARASSSPRPWPSTAGEDCPTRSPRRCGTCTC